VEKGKEERCSNCRYYYPGSDNRGPECHRHAPIGNNKHSDAEWPEVYPYMWCGDFAPIPAPEPELSGEPKPEELCMNCYHFICYSNIDFTGYCVGYKTVTKLRNYCTHFTRKA